MKELWEGSYLKATGQIDPKYDNLPAELGVIDSFIDGSDCDKAYESVYNIHKGIIEELHDHYLTTGAQTDKDTWIRYDNYLEEIINHMTAIQNILGEKCICMASGHMLSVLILTLNRNLTV